MIICSELLLLFKLRRISLSYVVDCCCLSTAQSPMVSGPVGPITHILLSQESLSKHAAGPLIACLSFLS
jgi:hypothetical protein